VQKMMLVPCLSTLSDILSVSGVDLSGIDVSELKE
jgi:hypothetical protein